MKSRTEPWSAHCLYQSFRFQRTICIYLLEFSSKGVKGRKIRENRILNEVNNYIAV